MIISVPIRSGPRPWLLLCLWSMGSAVPWVCLAREPAVSQVSIDARSIRLPVVDAVDNRFLRLSTAEGLSQTKADHIVQDNQGFIWFGTRYGLHRYDGYTFKVFVRDPG